MTNTDANNNRLDRIEAIVESDSRLFWGDKHIEKQAVTITKQHQVEEKNNWEINFSNIFEPIK